MRPACVYKRPELNHHPPPSCGRYLLLSSICAFLGLPVAKNTFNITAKRNQLVLDNRRTAAAILETFVSRTKTNRRNNNAETNFKQKQTADKEEVNINSIYANIIFYER